MSAARLNIIQLVKSKYAGYEVAATAISALEFLKTLKKSA